MSNANKKFVLLPLFLLPAMTSAAEVSVTDISGLDAFYGDEDFVSIATGSNKPIPKAPAVATVITAEDIATIGATDLDQALETVPGLHVARSTFMYNPIYAVRGIYSNLNPQILVLVNGIPITNVFQGDRNFIWGGMPVKAISRIEVIRGPGSAIYGADAFAGVINIVTKDATDISDTKTGARAGSFNALDIWLLHSKTWNGFSTALSIEAGTTEGHNETITQDAQTGLDELISSLDPAYEGVSLAPGPVNLGRKHIDIRFDISRNVWRFRSGFQGRYKVESGAGAGALDPAMKYNSERFNADLSYNNSHFAKDWEITANASFLHTTQEVDEPFVLFPPGADFTVIGGGGPFPNGVIGAPEVSERHYRLGVSAFYSGFSNHRTRLGAGWKLSDLYKVAEAKNFLSNAFGLPIPHPEGLIDVGDTPAVFLPEKKRTIHYVFVQDEWTLARDWDFTSGIRYDHYSDFGDTVNPRFALVWQTAYNLTSKLLYGRAFRAPAFAELHSQNNPVQLGNPHLDPEIIDTLELALDYRPAGNLHGTLSLFVYRMKDIIQSVADPEPATTSTLQNTGRQKGHGFELEGEWEVSQNFTLLGNFAYQRSKDESDDSDTGFAPQRQLYMRADWRFAPTWKLNGQLNWVMNREREPDDSRSQISDYTLIDLTLRRIHNAENKLGLTFSVRNVFDEEAAEPVPASTGIPNDLPLAGRNYYLEAEYTF